MAKELIDALGGPRLVAEALNIKPNAVSNWLHQSRDIPWKRRHAVAQLAAERGVALPANFWGAGA